MKSTTISSKSDTHKLDTPIQFVKGVGPRLGSVFAGRDIRTVRDLFHFFPRGYEDRTRLSKISELAGGERATISLRVCGARKIPLRGGGRSLLEVRCSDETGGTLSLKWFHAPRGMEGRFIPGTQLIASGLVKFYMNRLEMVHPELTWTNSTGTECDSGRVVPVYPEIEGVTSKVLRRILWEALNKYGNFTDEDLPRVFLQTHRLPSLGNAIRAIHFPEETAKGGEAHLVDLMKFNTPAHWRLIYEEFFKFEYLVLKKRLRMEKAQSLSFGLRGGRKAASDLSASLPFKLTRDQVTAIEDILKNLAETHPMNRLLQGDVGSGKTAVALLSAVCVLAEGGQVALMVPTEILADQHYRNAFRIFGGKINVALLTGKTAVQERKKLQATLWEGEPILVIGTHALLEEPVAFKNLRYIMIDEQHRFGVDQRRILRDKGTYGNHQTGKPVLPHCLAITATPIPRTLALTAYGDLSVTAIRELPPGRTPVETWVVKNNLQRVNAYDRVLGQLNRGHQAYFIFPLINESDAEGFTQLKSAVAEAERLAREVFPGYKIGLLHGQMRPDEKASVMDTFKRNEIQVLVSTTVIEVGVDVPNATAIVIEHAERFGLSQLHQLRGRVGRGVAPSICFLFSHEGTAEATDDRLEVLEKTNDGFRIAEADLEIRGPGEFLGTRQAGSLPFRLANLVRDREWLLKSRDDAIQLLRDDPDLEKPENQPLRQYYTREGSLQFERLKTS